MSNAMEPQGGEGGSQPHDSGGTKRERLKFGAFTFTRSPAGRSVVQVELEHDGKKFVGRAEGSSSPVADLRMGADAAIQAVREFLAGGMGLELLGVKLVRAFDANVAIVSVMRRPTAGGILVGCCLADKDPVRAAALSVLNATNRIIEIYIAESRAQPPSAPPS